MRPIFAKRTGVAAKPSQATRVLTHMAESHAKAAAKADMVPTANSKTPSKTPSYPWGLSFSLDHGSLQKLGMTGAPKAGSTMNVHARVKVKSASSSQDDGGKPQHRAELQITHMMMGEAAEERAERRGTKAPIVAKRAPQRKT